MNPYPWSLFLTTPNGLIPAPIPLKELKLLCPPPGKPYYYCVFHNLISFFILSFLSSFLIKYKTFFGHALALLTLSPQKILYLIKRCYCFVLSVLCFLKHASAPSKLTNIFSYLFYLIGFSLTQVVLCLRLDTIPVMM